MARTHPSKRCAPQYYRFCKVGKVYRYKFNKANIKKGRAGKEYMRYTLTKVDLPRIR